MCWRGPAITRWMWPTAWWSGEATRWAAPPSRGVFPMSTTRMTSETSTKSILLRVKQLTLISWGVVRIRNNLRHRNNFAPKNTKGEGVEEYWYFDGYCDVIWALDIVQILNVKCSKGPLSVIPKYWSFIANCQDFILNSTFHTGKLNGLKLWESLLTCFKASSFKEQHFTSDIISDKHGMDGVLITIFYV